MWKHKNFINLQLCATFKHFYDAGTIGSGTVKFRHYSQQEPTPPSPAYTDCLTFTGETSEFTLNATNKTWDGALQWSTDHNTWTTLDGTEVMQSVDKKLYIRGKDNTTFYDSSNEVGVEWELSENASCSGNIQTLLDWENPPISINADYCYADMFGYCLCLTTAPELSATVLSNYCYSNMFNGCSGLITAPELPATTLGNYCYENMFTGCDNLTSTPVLPATTLAEGCYSYMFSGCTKLTTASKMFATTLAKYCCSQMFNNCTSLTQPPELLSTTLSESCYDNMFQGCTSLTTAPELPATALARYCYYAMFSGCTALTTAPELPAITLEYGCYAEMFFGCTNLKTAPMLPANTLVNNCYFYMFRNCSRLKVNTLSGNKIFTCPTNIPSAAVDLMFTNTGGSFTGTPTAGTTYYYTE